MRIAVLLPLAVWPALIAASGAYAKDPPTPPVTHYWHNWTDGKGLSHLTRSRA